MTYQELVAEIKQLPPEERLALLAEVAQSLRADIAQARTHQDAKPTTKLTDEPFVGMWQDRHDLADSTQWVREVRDQEWMSVAGKLFAGLTVDKETTVEFFIVFARFEYALKRGGFARSSDDGKRVAAGWEKFARELQIYFRADRTKELQDAVKYLDNSPPRQQYLKDNNLLWKDTVREQNEDLLPWLLRLVGRVRNNLFHGGKFPEGPIREISRDTDLLSSSLVILNECLELCEQHNRDVYHFFFDRME